MKTPPARATGDGGVKQIDSIDSCDNLVRFPTRRKLDTPEQATAVIREIAFRRHINHLHRLGPRAIGEFLAEVGARHSCRTWIEDRLADFAMVDPATLADLEGWRR